MQRARFTYDSNGTHQPVLYEALLRTSGLALEFGCGHNSTELMHRVCEKQNRHLISFEDSKEWLDKFRHLVTPWHEFVFVKDWSKLLVEVGRKAWMYCGLAFVDQTGAPFEARAHTVQLLKNTAKYIVLHDCDYFPEHGFFGESFAKLNGPQDRGRRTYDDVFRFWNEFFPEEPWLFPRTGPPTLLGSNFELCDWEIDFSRYELEELLF